MRSSLWTIQTDFTHKNEFRELTYCQAFLKEQKRMVKQLDMSLAALEKGYKAQAATMGALVGGPCRLYALESARVKHFTEQHQLLAAQFSKYSVDLANLRGGKVATLRSALSANYKSITTDLAKMKSAITEPSERVSSRIKNHERSINNVVSVASGKQPMGVMKQQPIAVQLARELRHLDEEMDASWDSYL